MFYSSEAEELRAFVRDKLGFTFTDVGDGWLIFNVPESDLGVHPTVEGEGAARSGAHSISFYCDDIEATVADLKAKGVEFVDEVIDRGFGLVTHFRMPGDVVVQLYQAHYTKTGGAMT
jgi:catechol 2,3-dioxygenase-like lactoylglutathione lyase family enzyme